MENRLLLTLEIVERFNKKLGTKVISEKEFKEEKKNIGDFVKEIKNLDVRLKRIKESKLENYDTFAEELVELHINYSNLIWHFEQVHELIKKIMCNFPTERL